MGKNIGLVDKACVGCRSCEQVCPVSCISFMADKEGFLYPQINTSECIQCGKCLMHCPVLEKKGRQNAKDVYGVKNRNRKKMMQSASGGLSDLAAQYILSQNGCVFGCAYDEELRVRHIEITDRNDLYKIQSSKYVQSDLGKCYTDIKKRLECGKIVLFTGTPCQVGGLYSYLGEENRENLYTIDLICHGVPSPLFFEKYLEYQKKKLGEEIEYYNFRSKEKRGWGTQCLIKTATKTKESKLSLDKYGKHFMEGSCYRECCYRCEYANTERVGDITCGDFWGIEKKYPLFVDSAGVSVALVNTQQGRRLFNEMREDADVIKVSLEDVLPQQGNLTAPTKRPLIRDDFYSNIESPEFMEQIKTGIQLKERLKSILPQKVILALKSKIR